jgi:hypothetical protein
MLTCDLRFFFLTHPAIWYSCRSQQRPCRSSLPSLTRINTSDGTANGVTTRWCVIRQSSRSTNVAKRMGRQPPTRAGFRRKTIAHKNDTTRDGRWVPLVRLTRQSVPPGTSTRYASEKKRRISDSERRSNTISVSESINFSGMNKPWAKPR